MHYDSIKNIFLYLVMNFNLQIFHFHLTKLLFLPLGIDYSMLNNNFYPFMGNF
jgi:hypothetical protein